ncbi:MAG TPA: hypothetical protein DCX07_09245 [Phycisphaerales bacterium]|nr:hypothetical protein [Phycisphaerales bacterium]
MTGAIDKNLWRMLAVATLAAVVAAAPARAQQTVSSEQVRSAIQKGVARIRQLQRPDGNWSGGGHRGGITALSMLALLNAGVSAQDPALQKGLDALLRVPDDKTYVVALKCQVLAAIRESLAPADRAQIDAQLQKSADWLVNAQLPTGMWSYGSKSGRGDNSNTQFAVLGLHEAAKGGAKIPARVWALSKTHFENTQSDDGGWAYHGKGKSYGSMTTAGLASLFICGQQLHVSADRRFVNGVYLGCGKYLQHAALAAGLNWMSRNFSVETNPGRGATWLYYYLYGMERVGMISGRRNFGKNDWYRQGATFLAGENLQKDSGQWNNDVDTAFALLFLAKGNRPVLIQKVQWLGNWNRNIHDLENLTAFIGDKLGKRTTWQTTSLDLPLEDLRQSPILFITGHEFPVLTPGQERTLREFVEAGGTLLFEACCGSEEFAKGFGALAKKLWPEYLLRPLAKDHPLFSSYYKLDETYDIQGIDVGCRTSVFFSPHALSALWELKDVPALSELAMKLGTNLGAYATGREQLPDKLDVVVLPAQDKREGRPAEIPRGAVRIARLQHGGHCNADPHALIRLAEHLRDKAKVDVVAKDRYLSADDGKIFEYPVVFMTGHYNFSLSDKEIENLRVYLQRGGCLVADACCGEKAFDKSFREMAAKLFPDAPLEPLEEDHPIYSGKIGVPLGEVRYRAVLAEQLNSRGTQKPPLEAVRLGGRTAILYSKHDWSCALEGDRPYSCRGYQDEDGTKLAINIFLYVISY